MTRLDNAMKQFVILLRDLRKKIKTEGKQILVEIALAHDDALTFGTPHKALENLTSLDKDMIKQVPRDYPGLIRYFIAIRAGMEFAKTNLVLANIRREIEALILQHPYQILTTPYVKIMSGFLDFKIIQKAWNQNLVEEHIDFGPFCVILRLKFTGTRFGRSIQGIPLPLTFNKNEIPLKNLLPHIILDELNNLAACNNMAYAAVLEFKTNYFNEYQDQFDTVGQSNSENQKVIKEQLFYRDHDLVFYHSAFNKKHNTSVIEKVRLK